MIMHASDGEKKKKAYFHCRDMITSMPTQFLTIYIYFTQLHEYFLNGSETMKYVNMHCPIHTKEKLHK